MGFLDKLTGKGPLSERAIGKHVKLITNPYAQPDIRQGSMNKLLNDETAAAYRGVLKRFTVNASGNIADEEEKRWLTDELVEIGAPVVEPLKDFLRSEQNLNFACRALRRIMGDDEAVRFMLEVLDNYPPDDYRAAEIKLQLVGTLREIEHPAIFAALRRYLADHSDDVRWALLDMVEELALAKHPAAAEQETRRLLGESLFDGEERPRIQHRVAELAARFEWILPGEATELPSLLGDQFFLDKKRYVRRRAAAKKG